MSPAQRTFNGYPLPAVINPARRCIKFHIPDEANHRRAFYGAILELTKWFNWERDELKQGTEVATVWRDVFSEIIANMDKGCDECDDCPNEGGCIDIQPHHPTIEWIHSDPYDPTDCEPYWDCQPWDIVKDFAGFLPEGAVVTTAKNWAEGLSEDIITQVRDVTNRVLHPPGFKVKVKGSGRIQLYMTKVPLGGLAMITVDDNPLTAKFEDMATFTAGNFSSWANALELLTGNVISGGFFSDLIIEVELEIYKEHTVEVVFLPKIAFPDYLESGWGGGLRKIALCGVKPLVGGSEPPIVKEGSNGEVQIWDGTQYITLMEYLATYSSSDDCIDDCDEVNMACCVTNLRWNNGALEYMVCGEWKIVPGSIPPASQTPDVPTPPEGTVETSDNACFKANAGWWIIESFTEALFESVDHEFLQDAGYVYFQRNYGELDEDNYRLNFALGDFSSADPGTRTHWNTNKASIAADFICQAQDIFGKGARLTDPELTEVLTWNFSTGSNELNALLEKVTTVPERKFWFETAATYVDNQQGECNCIGDAADPDALPVGTGQIRLTAVEAFSRNVNTSMELLGETPASLMAFEGDDYTIPWGNGWTTVMFPDVPNNNSQYNPRYLYKIEGDFAAWEVRNVQVQFTSAKTGTQFTQVLLIGTSDAEENSFDIRWGHSSTTVFKENEAVTLDLQTDERWIAVLNDLVMGPGSNLTGFAGFVVQGILVKKLSDNSFHFVTPGQTLTA